MSRKAFLTIDGLYDWDNTLFASLQLPTQFSDASIITDELILETMNLEVLYPDPATFKKALGIFSRSRLQSWQKITDALYKSYDPFINFTRDEERTITQTRDLTDTRTDNLSSEGTNQVAAWDNNTNNLTDREKNTIKNTGTQTNRDAGTVTHHETFHSQGDSALFTPTDVAKKEFELRAMADAISYIVNDIKNRFCLTVY